MRLRSAVIAGLVFGIAGCSSTPEASESTTAPPTTTHDMGSMAMTSASGQVECAQHMPGDLLTAAEAMVVFDPEHVCLGYVTVVSGTTITWHNTDAVEHEVVVTDEAGDEVDHFTVGGGAAASSVAGEAGVYRFTLSAIESFVGTIEVQ